MLQQLKYISHGEQITGGYLHEQFLAKSLANALNLPFVESRQWALFEDKKAHINLLKWAFNESDSLIQISVSRLALPIIIKNLFSSKKTIIVWHFFDAKDGKSKFLRRYYNWLVRLALFIPAKKLAFVTVAPYWTSFFKDEFKLKKVFFFPNLIEEKEYDLPQKFVNKKQIHLGQVSFKNSAELFLLAELLHNKGYQCYMSTNDPKKVYQSKFYEVIYFEKHSDYLQKMASSAYTLAMPSIAEGWNRVAHESLLVGTQVIGFNKGGLGDLLKGANALMIGTKPISAHIPAFIEKEFGSSQCPPPSVVNALYIVLNELNAPINKEFLHQFSVSKTQNYLNELVQWCKQ
ncbi:MAG: glycosyltransferase family 4 protein [Bacteroidia bacterium]|nr:glycosyltransferase family 4 protein [Bacteroidia bacterium]